MSAHSVEEVLGRAIKEPDFRGLLLRDPGQALAGYDLSAAEVQALSALQQDDFDGGEADLEQRVSKSTGIIWGDSK